MTGKPVNPPAFPTESLLGADTGMTLRDYFAAAAMQGLLSNSGLAKTILAKGGATSGWVEQSAWAWAEGMLEARKL